MTKRPGRPKKSGLTHSGRVYFHKGDRELTEDFYLALMERYYETLSGPDDIAKSLAADLRRDAPHLRFLNMLALMLDPKVNCYFKLVIKRRRGGTTWSRRNNDAVLAKATNEVFQALGGNHGDLKRAVGEIADYFEVSEGAVRLARQQSKG